MATLPTRRATLPSLPVALLLAALGDGRDPVEGIWGSLDGRYRTVVARDARPGREYTMSILRADSV